MKERGYMRAKDNWGGNDSQRGLGTFNLYIVLVLWGKWGKVTQIERWANDEFGWKGRERVRSTREPLGKRASLPYIVPRTAGPPMMMMRSGWGDHWATVCPVLPNLLFGKCTVLPSPRERHTFACRCILPEEQIKTGKGNYTHIKHLWHVCALSAIRCWCSWWSFCCCCCWQEAQS